MTPRYASPEQLLGQPVTTASDIYQIGVLLYEVLTGEAINQDETMSAAIQRAADQKSVSLDRTARASIPRDLLAILALDEIRHHTSSNDNGPFYPTPTFTQAGQR